MNIRGFIKDVSGMELNLFIFRAPLRKILLGSVIINLLALLMPVYLIWVSPGNILFDFLYNTIVLFQIIILLFGGISILKSCYEGFTFSRKEYLKVPLLLLVLLLCFTGISVLTGDYYETLKTIHFNHNYSEYEKAVSKVRNIVMQEGEEYNEYNVGKIIPSARIYTESHKEGNKLIVDKVFFFKEGRIPCSRGGIIFFENDSASVRQWHKTTLRRIGPCFVSNQFPDRAYYKKLKPHWYLYTIK